jgi:phosphate transport system ATP-binding protein
MQPPKIDIRGLNFFFDKKQVIRDLSLEIPANEILAVFGPANSGTTTLLQAMNRLTDLKPGARAEGRILLDGKDVFDPATNVTELRRRVGMVFEVPTPLPLSIYDNVAYGPRLRSRKNHAELDEVVETALVRAALWDDVKDRLHTAGSRLSGGQQQRLCIARVLALEPEVVLLDRPCSGLDPISTAKIEESLRQLKERFTIVLIPHNVQQAGRVADNVAFMLMGSLIEHGATEEVFRNPKNQKTNDYITGRFG